MQRDPLYRLGRVVRQGLLLVVLIAAVDARSRSARLCLRRRWLLRLLLLLLLLTRELSLGSGHTSAGHLVSIGHDG